MMRGSLALITYWALFIIAPLALFIIWRGQSVSTAVLSVVLFLVLAVIGERGFRLWKRFWRVR